MPEESLRDSLEKAFDTTTEQLDSDVSTDAGGDGAIDDEPAPVVPESGGEPQPDEKGKVDSGRDEKGRFSKTKKPEVPGRPGGELEETQPTDGKAPAEAKKVEGAKPNEIPEAQQRLAASRAPGTWRPALREKWASLDPEIQQEVLRRERDIYRGMSEIADIRDFQSEFAKTVGPYQHIISAEGGKPLAVVNNLLATASALSHGTPMQKAQTAAAIINNFGVSLEILDGVLAGTQGQQPQQQQTNTAENYIRQEVQRVLAPVFNARQEQDNRMQQSVDQDIEAFATDPKNEFFDDVRADMADILELASKRGLKMDLPTAYNRAIMMNSEIAEIATARAVQAKVTQASAAAKAAKSRAVSVTGAPAKPADAVTHGDSLRDDLLSSIDSLS